MARLDALERSARTVTPASALRLPCLEASDITFDATRSGSCVELSRGGGVADCEERYGCAISTVTLRSGTHSWEIRLTRTDTIVGIGVCTESHGFHLDVEGENWCSGPLNRSFLDRTVAAAEAPWCKDVKNGSSLVVNFDCETGSLSVGPKGGLLMASHVFGELASTPVSPFVFLTSGNTCEIAPYVRSPPLGAPFVVPPVRQSFKRDRSPSPSSSRSPSPQRRSRFDDVTWDDGPTRESAAARTSDRRRAVAARPPAGGRGVDRWAGAQPDSDGSPPRRRARRVRVGAPARRSPNFSSGGGDAADAIDVDDEPVRLLPTRRPPRGQRRARDQLSSSSDDEPLADAHARRRRVARRGR